MPLSKGESGHQGHRTISAHISETDSVERPSQIPDHTRNAWTVTLLHHHDPCFSSEAKKQSHVYRGYLMNAGNRRDCLPLGS